jgi:hypothetical protein
LEELIRTVDAEPDRDLVWAEAHESLGDFFWTRRNQMNWGSAWPHYQQSLDWWAGQRQLERARDRYLTIVFKAAEPPRPAEYYYYTYYGNSIPLNILENALKISNNENQKAHLNFLIAMTMRYSGGDWEARARVPDEFEEAIKLGKKTDWYDDALYYYAEWMNSYGSIRQSTDGQWQQEPDYAKALELFQRITREFSERRNTLLRSGCTADQNDHRTPRWLSVFQTFSFPILNCSLHLTRNLRQVELALYKVDLIRDVRFSRSSDGDEGENEDWSLDPEDSDFRTYGGQDLA